MRETGVSALDIKYVFFTTQYESTKCTETANYMLHKMRAHIFVNAPYKDPLFVFTNVIVYMIQTGKKEEEI